MKFSVHNIRRCAGMGLVTVSLAMAIPLITIAPPNPNAQATVPYSSGCSASGGFPPYTYSVTSGALPGGLNLNQNTCAITGTPSTPGVFNFTITAFDSPQETGNVPLSQSLRTSRQAGPNAASGSTPFTITVSAAPVAAVGTPALSDSILVCLAIGVALLGGLFLKRRPARTV